MNKTLIIGIAIVAVVGIGVMLLMNEPAPVMTENDGPGTNDVVTQELDPTTENNVEDDMMTEPQTIVDLAVANPELSTLTVAVDAAGLIGALTAEGPFTVLAPNDTAFAALPEGTLDTLVQPENVEDLQAILGLHVIPGIATSADLEDGMTVTTLTGDTLTVTISDDGTVTIGDATVITADVTADNGVVHIIDSVITEPA